MNTLRSLTIVLACCLGFTACDRKKVQNETPAQPQDTGIDRLQPGDTIAAKIHQSPDFDVEAKIDPSGKVFFRLIGNVSVSGLTIAELEEKLQQLYQKDFDLKTDVSVSLKSRGTPEPSAHAQAAGIYRLRSGDKISMQMVAEPDIDTEATIGKSGSVSFPLIGMVVVEGLSRAELEKKLIGLYRENYFNDPKISVRITGYAGKTFIVAGAVKNPDSYPYPEEGTISLAQAVAHAGGIDETGNDQKITLSRKKGGASVHSLVAGGKVALYPGDTLVVPRLPIEKEARIITATVAGEVNRPGNIALPPGGKLNVLAAVVMAGGYSRIANQNEGILQRKVGNGFRVDTVKLKDIRNGKAPMVHIREGDIFIIKESRLPIEKEARIITATVSGEVKRPGKITLPRGGRIDVLTALAMAGGYSRVANQKEAILQRKDGAGFRVETLKLRDIRNRKAPMVYINEGDIIVIKKSLW